MRRAKGTGCITQMSNGRYKYRGLLRVGVNKNGNPKNKIFYGNTKREVENKINAYLNQDEPEIKEVLTFNDALDLLYHQSKKERVKQKTLSVIETTSKVLRKKWGEVSITNIFAKEVEDQFLLWESEYSFSQLQKLRNYAKKAFRVICEIYGVDLKNPFDLKIKSPDNAPRHNYFTEEEIYLINEASCELGSIYSEIPLFLYETGLRINECLALTYGDIDYENNVIDVNKTLSETKQANGKYKISLTTPKTKLSYRKVPLTQAARDIVYNNDQGYAKSTDLVFPSSKGTYISARNVLRFFDEVLEKANIEKKHRGLHTLRHSCVIRLFKQMSVNGRSREIDAIDISKIIGNKVDVSAYNYDNEQVDRANRIREVLEENERRTFFEEPEIAYGFSKKVIESCHLEFSKEEVESALRYGKISYKEKELFKKFAYRCHEYVGNSENLSYPVAAGQLIYKAELWDRFKITGTLDLDYIDSIKDRLMTDEGMAECYRDFELRHKSRDKQEN